MTDSHGAFRLPAEFDPVEAVWLARPNNLETWPGCLDKAQAQHANFVAALECHTAPSVKIEVIGRDRGWPVFDAWVRDYGPIFVLDQNGGKACHDFRFNGWGDKYDPRYRGDSAVARWIADDRKLPIKSHDFVLEGGSIDPNGRGTLLTTEQCLLHPNRNPDLDRSQIEAFLIETLALERIVWLPGGIVGDDTDGHVDDIARFVAPDTVAAVLAPKHHPDAEVLEANWQTLEKVRVGGAKLELLPLPVPEPLVYAYPGEGGRASEERPLPASYANFLIVNDALFLPVFGQRSDDTAARRLEDATGKTIVPLRSEWLIVGLGALHCLSMQEPASIAHSGVDSSGTLR